jgi:hypothetical protein
MSRVMLWHKYIFKMVVIINHSLLEGKRAKLQYTIYFVQTLCNLSTEIVNFSTIVPLAQIHVAVFCIITEFLSRHFSYLCLLGVR